MNNEIRIFLQTDPTVRFSWPATHPDFFEREIQNGLHVMRIQLVKSRTTNTNLSLIGYQESTEQTVLGRVRLRQFSFLLVQIMGRDLKSSRSTDPWLPVIPIKDSSKKSSSIYVFGVIKIIKIRKRENSRFIWEITWIYSEWSHSKFKKYLI